VQPNGRGAASASVPGAIEPPLSFYIDIGGCGADGALEPRPCTMTARQRTQTAGESGLHIYAANRLETLLDALAAAIHSDPLGPLEREVIVVQSRGMYRWVTLELARKLGIAATIATPFPGTFCEALAERVEGARAAAPSERYEPAPG